MGNGGLLWGQCRGIGHHLDLIWATLIYFTFLQWHQCPSRIVRVFFGTLWSSIKQIKGPSMFDWEHGNVLHTMQGNWASSLDEGEVSWFFSSWGWNLGYILELRWNGLSKLMYVQRHQHSCLIARENFKTLGSRVFVQRHQDSCLVVRDTWEFSSRLCRAIGTPLDMRQETEGPFPCATGILGF